MSQMLKHEDYNSLVNWTLVQLGMTGKTFELLWLNDDAFNCCLNFMYDASSKKTRQKNLRCKNKEHGVNLPAHATGAFFSKSEDKERLQQNYAFLVNTKVVKASREKGIEHIRSLLTQVFKALISNDFIIIINGSLLNQFIQDETRVTFIIHESLHILDSPKTVRPVEEINRQAKELARKYFEQCFPNHPFFDYEISALI